MNDLFIDRIPKVEQLKTWMREQRHFSTHAVIAWGCRNFFNRANRDKQELCEKGIIRVASEFEKYSFGHFSKDEFYVWIGEKESA